MEKDPIGATVVYVVTLSPCTLLFASYWELHKILKEVNTQMVKVLFSTELWEAKAVWISESGTDNVSVG